MSKEYSNYIKGIAILLMVYLHIFQSGDVAQLDYLVSIGDTSLLIYITSMCNPVPFFLILSGYGLYAVYGKLGG